MINFLVFFFTQFDFFPGEFVMEYATCTKKGELFVGSKGELFVGFLDAVLIARIRWDGKMVQK
jgi:hypothetical protein